MIRLFVDTNIMLDLLGERAPFYDAIAKIATLADTGEVSLIVSALSYSIVFYLLLKYEGKDKVREKLRKFKIISELAAVDAIVIEKSLNSAFANFENSLQYFCALKAECDVLLTRNQRDFKESSIPVLSAEEYLMSIKKK
jgi:predicted nucleic acid-binding protein